MPSKKSKELAAKIIGELETSGLNREDILQVIQIVRIRLTQFKNQPQKPCSKSQPK